MVAQTNVPTNQRARWLAGISLNPYGTLVPPTSATETSYYWPQGHGHVSGKPELLHAQDPNAYPIGTPHTVNGWPMEESILHWSTHPTIDGGNGTYCMIYTGSGV